MIDAGYAEYLRATALFASASPAGPDWGDAGIETEVVSPLALQVDAEVEAAREAAFFAGPIVRDRHLVRGLRRDLYLRRVDLTIDRLGYQAGVRCVVIGVRELEDKEMTELTVLRRLA